MDALMPVERHLVLHLGGIEFIDSAGLGLLVRCLTRARNAFGDLKVCAVSPKVDDVLRVTRLTSIFQAYESEAEAIADAHRVRREADDSFLDANVLCVDRSPDVLAYLRELLKGAGHRVITAGNLPDALVLLRATLPKVVVIGAELRAARDTRTAEEFHRLADASALVELPSDLSREDAADAAEQVLRAVEAAVKRVSDRAAT
jgi:CheY-like chemotaxis protein